MGTSRGARHWPYQLPCSAGVGERRIEGPLPHSLISFPLSCRQETHYCNNRSLGSAGKGEQCRAAPAGRPKARTTRGVAMPATSSSPAPPLSKEKMRLQHPTDRKTWCKGMRGKANAHNHSQSLLPAAGRKTMCPSRTLRSEAAGRHLGYGQGRPEGPRAGRCGAGRWQSPG